MKLNSIRGFRKRTPSYLTIIASAMAAVVLMLPAAFFDSNAETRSDAAPQDTVVDPAFSAGVTEGKVQGHVSTILPDGKILVGGGFSLVNGVEKNTLARLNSDGSLDTSFNVAGGGPNGLVFAIIPLADGKVLIGGNFTQYNGIPKAGIARLESNGLLDTTFNDGGAGVVGTVQGMALDSTGKILISGSGITSYNGVTKRSIVRINPDGSLDPSFTTPFATSVFVEEVDPLADGKVLIGGAFNNNSRTHVMRLNNDGSADLTFNSAGGGTNGPVFAMTVQPDGKILIGGEFDTYNGVARMRGARLNADGTLDTGFIPPPTNGGNGPEHFAVLPDGSIVVAGGFTDGVNTYPIVVLDPDGTEIEIPEYVADGIGYHVARQPDGKIILSGYFNTINGQPRRNIIRFNADASIDNTFNAAFSGFGFAASMAQQADGKLVVAGNFDLANGSARPMVARFNLDGTIDNSFANPLGTDSDRGYTGNIINTVAAATGGKTYIGGVFGFYNGTQIRKIARLNADGSLDTGFNASFIATRPLGQVNEIIVLQDGKLLVGGFFTNNVDPATTMVRLNTDGSLDASFTSTPNSTVSRMVRQSDGKIIIGGAFTTVNGISRTRIARINADGTLDTTFDPGSGTNSTVSSIALQADGKVLIGGLFTTVNGVPRNRIARLNADGSVDTSFDPGSGANSTVESIVLSPAGRIMIAGRFSTYNGSTANRLARINDNGSFDSSYVSGFDGDPRFFARRLVYQFDGKLLVAGLFKQYGGETHNGIVRLFTPETTGGDQPILFTSNRNGNNDVFRMNADGTNQQALTNSPENEGAARWSPDGGKIAFTKIISSSQIQIWLMNADGSNPLLISDATGVHSLQDWSPDSQKILFGRKEGSFIDNLWTMSPDGTNKMQITTQGKADHIASWSPDGGKIAFGRCTADAQLDDCNIFTMNSDGSSQLNLTPTNPSDDDAANWTPDGTQIVFGRSSNGSDFNTYIMNAADGSNVLPLTNVVSPHFYTPDQVSPDGSRVGMTYRGSQVSNFEVSTVDLSGSNLVHLTNNEVVDLFGRWSPDSSQIAFMSRRDTPANEIYVMNADGSGVVRLTFNSAIDTVSDWYTPLVPEPTQTRFDFDADGKTDISVWRPADGNWHISRSTDGYAAYAWGASGDRVVPADFDGDGKADVAVWRPVDGTWHILNSNGGTYSSYTWGASGDVPVVGDYDDDGKADVAVYRPADGNWHVRRSSDGGYTNVVWGVAGDVPVAGDFDGDGQSDIAVRRPSTGEWFINRSTAGYISVTWGVGTDVAVHADYDGDQKDDIAVWRPSTGEWFILRSSDGGFTQATWGATGDVPVPGDYDGDGRADISVVRNGVWHISQSTDGYRTTTWGVGSDIAIPGRY